MYTFFQIKREPKIGTVCQNPTSRLQSVVIGFTTEFDEDKVVIINERGRCQKIEYNHFCERYAYKGESTQNFEKLFIPTKKSLGYNKSSFDVGDIIQFSTNIKYLITHKFMRETSRGIRECAILVNENGTHVTKEMVTVNSAVFVGTSKVRMKYMLNLKEETYTAVKAIMKGG